MRTFFFFYLAKELWVHLKNKREGIASLSFSLYVALFLFVFIALLYPMMQLSACEHRHNKAYGLRQIRYIVYLFAL